MVGSLMSSYGTRTRKGVPVPLGHRPHLGRICGLQGKVINETGDWLVDLSAENILTGNPPCTDEPMRKYVCKAFRDMRKIEQAIISRTLGLAIANTRFYSIPRQKAVNPFPGSNGRTNWRDGVGLIDQCRFSAKEANRQNNALPQVNQWGVWSKGADKYE